MPTTTTIRKDVKITGSVYNDFKDIREFYRKNEVTLIKAFDECKKIFEIDNVTLLIRNIRKRSTVGSYNNGQKQINLDLRRFKLKDIVSTIIHEMTHAKQYKDGRLKDKTNAKATFENVEYSCPKNMSHQKYLDLPWEIEAREMQKKYIDQVWKSIK
mgnify:FL=1